MTINPHVKFTYQDYMSLPESEEKQYELIDGELYVVPSPSTIHQFISQKLFTALYEFVREKGLGVVLYAPIDVILSKYDVFQPDILFISNERRGIITEQNIQGAPDLVVEILSPSTANRDRLAKRSRYLKFGVREYWIVDPQAKTIEVLKAGQTDFETVRVFPESTSATSPLLEGIQLDVRATFS